MLFIRNSVEVLSIRETSFKLETYNMKYFYQNFKDFCRNCRKSQRIAGSHCICRNFQKMSRTFDKLCNIGWNNSRFVGRMQKDHPLPVDSYCGRIEPSPGHVRLVPPARGKAPAALRLRAGPGGGLRPRQPQPDPRRGPAWVPRLSLVLPCIDADFCK